METNVQLEWIEKNCTAHAQKTHNSNRECSSKNGKRDEDGFGRTCVSNTASIQREMRAKTHSGLKER